MLFHLFSFFFISLRLFNGTTHVLFCLWSTYKLALEDSKPCEGRHTEWYQAKEAKGLNTFRGFRLLHSTNIEHLPIEALYSMLGINRGLDMVLVSILLSYINHGSPINLAWVAFFFYKYFTYYLLLLRPTHTKSIGHFTRSMEAIIFPKIIWKRLLLKLKKCAIF